MIMLIDQVRIGISEVQHDLYCLQNILSHGSREINKQMRTFMDLLSEQQAKCVPFDQIAAYMPVDDEERAHLELVEIDLFELQKKVPAYDIKRDIGAKAGTRDPPEPRTVVINEETMRKEIEETKKRLAKEHKEKEKERKRAEKEREREREREERYRQRDDEERVTERHSRGPPLPPQNTLRPPREHSERRHSSSIDKDERRSSSKQSSSRADGRGNAQSRKHSDEMRKVCAVHKAFSHIYMQRPYEDQQERSTRWQQDDRRQSTRHQNGDTRAIVYPDGEERGRPPKERRRYITKRIIHYKLAS